MTIPGVTGDASEAELLERADEEAEQLLEELKEKVQVSDEDIGPLRKRLTVTVPEDIIAKHLEQNFKELRADAVVPGFRKGRAPLPLVQKRFGSDVRESLKTMILGQSYYAAVDKLELETLGDPLLCIETDAGEKLMEVDEALTHISLPASGDFSYQCEVEIKPDFELPNLKGIQVKVPKFEITDEMIDETIERQCKVRGRLEPVADGPARKGDVIIADVKLTVDGQEIVSEQNVELGARPAVIQGVLLDDLGDKLDGARIDQAVTVDCQIPDDYERTELRGKAGQVEITVREIKRLVPITPEQLAEESGAESVDELRDFLRDEMAEERERLVRRAKREQVVDYLLENTELELPEKLSARQVERAVVRRIIDLRQMGMPDGEIQARIDDLRSSAREQVARELKLQFIMEKVAEELGVEVTDEEINSEIAYMARLYNRRFDRMRDMLYAQGMLSELVDTIREGKCIERLVADAQIEEVEKDSDQQTSDSEE